MKTIQKLDLTGQRFGKLTVLERAPSVVQPSGQTKTRWKCVCDCGNEVIVRQNELRTGDTKSCGCTKRNLKHDLTGKQFGHLTVIRPCNTEENVSGRTRYICLCDCGKEIVRRADVLIDSNEHASCGCHSGDSIKGHVGYTFRDLTGMKFNNLTVIERVYRDVPYAATFWRCKCDCGNETVVNAYRLVHGITHSCGCYARKRSSETRLQDLTGQQFGEWTVLERGEDYVCPSNGAHCIRWKCRCSCGTERLVFATVLKSGSSQSCGCKRESRGEARVAEMLDTYEIDYVREYSFKDLKSIKNGLLRFDFAIFKNNTLQYLIEYQGIQHYIGGTEKWFGYSCRMFTDDQKREYCKKNNIKLYEIRYDADVEAEVFNIIEENKYIDDDTVPSNNDIN